MDGQSSGIVARQISKDDEMNEQQRRLEECLQQVLSSQRVCENIASYLSLSDMKAASEGNRQFLQAIRGTQRFTQKAVLAITDKNSQKSTLQKTEYSWRGVRIDVTDSSDILDDLPRVLQSAQFVCLGAPPGKIKNARLLTTVLNSTPALSHLQISTHFLIPDLRTVLSSPTVQQTLKNLIRLDLVRNAEAESDCEVYSSSFNSYEFMRNFDLLTGLPNRLKCFTMTRSTPIKNRIIYSINHCVLRLLRNNRATLEELEFHSILWQIKELQTFTFPALKTLTASVEKLCDGRTLRGFLKNQRSLEELTLTLMANVTAGNPLHAAIMKCSVGLKKFHLTLPNFSRLNWNLLTSMNRLKISKLRGSENWNSLLASLRKDQLECLCLEGLWNPSEELFGFWKHCGVEEFHLKLELPEGFRYLRKISFLESRDAVDDQLMQWLLKEFSLLEEFQLSDCSTLTDAGISGNTTAECGRDASFADLRCLATLKIVRCDGVTPNGVLASCLNVPSLKSLEYSNPPGPIVESVVMELVERNSRLESLVLDYHGDVADFWELKAKVMKKHPRVELSLSKEE